ncbi:cell division cycle protein 16-like protein [Euroglyphus maynei]|uniref:Cell division cycle protein 16-like protein n=1 Tax=Euroglyphus maynei TaxID=6958 RepID=A0A1Y3BBB0_EURMA|nr:cell division cycle protein 16-like protein [Euroglyphus maynei]
MKSLSTINSNHHQQQQQRQKTCPNNAMDDDNEHLIRLLRLERDRLIQRLQYESAIFVSDKIIAINGMNINDGFILIHCIYLSKQYQRAAHLLQHNHLHEMDVQCCCLLVKCLMKIKKYLKALTIIDSCLKTRFDDSKWRVPLLVLRSEAYECLDNHIDARQSLIQALEQNFLCYEAFYRITHHHMATKLEELDILYKLIMKSRSERSKFIRSFMTDFMIFFYYIQLKKYDKPDRLIVRKPFQLFAKNVDFLIAQAERHFYNFDLIQALEITSMLIEQDPHNFECLEIHISCLLSLERSIELFKLSQNLIDLYPEHEISWYSLGCYYHLIKKKEVSRRYLQKAVTLNNVFAPAWLLYGHSFSDDGEHDQVMATYFKASHLMPGCHLPLLYIGVEYARTENHKLGEKFICTALTIAPEDPLVLHELSVTAFHSDELLKADRYLRQALRALKYVENKDEIRIQYEPLFSNMGHIQRKLGRYIDAIEFFKKSLSLSPNNPSTYSSIGLVYCMLDKYSEAVDYLDHAHGLNRLFKRDDVTKDLLDDALKFYPDSIQLPSGQSDLPDLNQKLPPWSDSDNRIELARNLAKQSTLMSNNEKQNNENNDDSILMIR